MLFDPISYFTILDQGISAMYRKFPDFAICQFPTDASNSVGVRVAISRLYSPLSLADAV